MNANYLIIVGVDGSEGGRRALEWATREAATRGGAVQAVVAWSWDGIDTGPATPSNHHEAKRHAVDVLEREIRTLFAHRGSATPVAGEVMEGRPADVLTAAARPADLLVLGSHGHSRLRHTVLGSVSEECIRKATCPVVVIPVPAATPTRSAEPAVRS